MDKLYVVATFIVAFLLAMFLAFVQGAFAQQAMCVEEQDALALAFHDTQGTMTPAMFRDGRCALIKRKLTYLYTVESYKDSSGKESHIDRAFVGENTHAQVYVLSNGYPSYVHEITWKPEFGQSPQAWIDWFNAALLTPEASKRLHWVSCCSHADRFKTSFKFDQHWYYQVGAAWVQIPDDTVEQEDPTMPQQLKEEGVLFLYQGKVTCFWPPETGG